MKKLEAPDVEETYDAVHHFVRNHDKVVKGFKYHVNHSSYQSSDPDYGYQTRHSYTCNLYVPVVPKPEPLVKEHWTLVYDGGWVGPEGPWRVDIVKMVALYRKEDRAEKQRFEREQEAHRVRQVAEKKAEEEKVAAAALANYRRKR